MARKNRFPKYIRIPEPGTAAWKKALAAAVKVPTFRLRAASDAMIASTAGYDRRLHEAQQTVLAFANAGRV